MSGGVNVTDDRFLDLVDKVEFIDGQYGQMQPSVGNLFEDEADRGKGSYTDV